MSNTDKLKALQLTLDKLEKSYGKGAVMKLGDEAVEPLESISTGSLGLDIALGIGGLPKGRVIEIYGPESSGKTTLATHVIAEAQKKGGIAAFIDAEHAFDKYYAQKLGVDVENLLIAQPDNGEQALEIADNLIRSGAIDIIVIDSVAALVPKAEIEGIMFGNPETTTGGNALKFYASVRLDIRRISQIKETDEVTGNRVKVKIVKNKVAPPFRIAEFDIMFGEGISKAGEVVDLGVEFEIIKKAGSWFSYGDTKLGQGRDAVKQLLLENPELMEELEAKIKEVVTGDKLEFKPE